MNDRPDLESFSVGSLYRCDHTDQVFEFRGVARVPELWDERVGVFELLGNRGELVVVTNAGYDHGERFTPLGDAIADDIDMNGGGPR
jgi:hypothetical protein